jgi:hypothetical protein
MASGVSCRFSCRNCAVTMTSSRVSCAGAAAQAAGANAMATAMDTEFTSCIYSPSSDKNLGDRDGDRPPQLRTPALI